MKKIHSVLASIIAAAFALTALGAVPAQAAGEKAPAVDLIVEIQDGQIRLAPKDAIVIFKTNNPTTGFRVSAKVEGKKKSVKLTKGIYVQDANPNGAVGVGGVTNWALEGLKPGVAYVVVTTTAPSGEVTLTERLKVIVAAAQK